MLTAHDAYVKARESLFSVKTNKDIQEASRKSVENYLENISIWKELNYYKEHGHILGKHRMFAYLNRIQAIRGMTIGDLVRLKMRLENNLVKNRSRVRKEPKHPETAKRQVRIKEMQDELSQVNQLLNL